ncbi:MAG: hypothetical protein ERJ67_07985 [Aphanocapsa feldmannii 277cV]|uniref:Uncharacterized protein n=1 Tax=Aphanocapsa feldmannii 277cV TaxID=2507553 RepID=A0A524RM93_9CHRO|nr:MAG: hypothetical protein ERJ67_07985 [Aphanocapsa feldmannii 277cV]
MPISQRCCLELCCYRAQVHARHNAVIPGTAAARHAADGSQGWCGSIRLRPIQCRSQLPSTRSPGAAHGRHLCWQPASAFLPATQPDSATRSISNRDGPTGHRFLAQHQGEISKRGSIDVLSHGIKHGLHHSGVAVEICRHRPS